MTSMNIEHQQNKTVVKKFEVQGVELAPEVSKTAADPLDEVLSQAEMAYTAYLEAQRKVALAYKHRERQEEKTYKEIERQANKACLDRPN